MTDHFALVPPESPVLNGGDWLDLGTKECPACDGVGGPYPVKGNLTAPRCLTCNGSGRVPVVPTWPCPTCGGSGTSGPEFVDEFGASPCLDCEGEGVVHSGVLTVGVAAHECPQHKQFRESGRIQIGWTCLRFGCDGTVPAALTEIITVQAYPVVEYPDTEQYPCVYLSRWDLRGYNLPSPYPDIIRIENANDAADDITEHFPVKPLPGEWVGRVVERRALTEPITEYPCRECGATGRVIPEGCRPGDDEWPWCPSCFGDPIALPQGVGWYEADEALMREIERRMP